MNAYNENLIQTVHWTQSHTNINLFAPTHSTNKHGMRKDSCRWQCVVKVIGCLIKSFSIHNLWSVCIFQQFFTTVSHIASPVWTHNPAKQIYFSKRTPLISAPAPMNECRLCYFKSFQSCIHSSNFSQLSHSDEFSGFETKHTWAENEWIALLRQTFTKSYVHWDFNTKIQNT